MHEEFIEDDMVLYQRALRLQKQTSGKYSVPYIIKFIKEWEEITSRLKKKYNYDRG